LFVCSFLRSHSRCRARASHRSYRCCLNTAYANDPTYNGQQFVFTTNEPCCPQSLAISDGNGGFICCPAGQVAADNGANGAARCCPASETVTIPPPFVGMLCV
jgi:hypothetical protein